MEDQKKIEMSPMFLSSVDDSRPFDGMKISDSWQILESIDCRTTCAVCNRTRKYFCYTCYLPLPGLEKHVPKVKLPIKVDIIKHSREKNGKSTASHAAVLAPEDVTIYTYPAIPDYGQEQNVVLVYPGKNAFSIEDVIKEFKENTEKLHSAGSKVPESEFVTHIRKAVFIDSTWNQSHGIFKDPRLQGLPCVVLKSRISQFWRYQSGSPRWYLSTIEAVHQFLVELFLSPTASYGKQKDKTDVTSTYLETNTHVIEGSSTDTERENIKTKNEENVETEIKFYNGEFDNLLFFFRFMYDKIHTMYDHKDLLSYKRPLN